MKTLLRFAVLIALFLVPQQALAAGLCCQLSSGVQESLLGVAAPETGSVSLTGTYSFTMMDKLREGTTERSLQDLASAGKYTILPTEMGMTKYSLTAAYRFSPKFSAFVTVPWIRNTMDMGMVMDMGMGMGKQITIGPMDPVDGLGDITVVGLYRLYANNDVYPTDTISLSAGIKTPTGSYKEKNSKGKFIHAHMQPGTGSWDPILSLIYTKMANPFLFQADVTYQIAARNSEGYSFGDSFTANAAVKYAVTRYFNVVGSATYLHLNRASDRDGKYTNLKSVMDDPANTGGDSVWLSPGIQLLPFKGSMIDVKVQLPVWERVNGVQLVSTYRVLASLSYAF